MSGSSGSDHDYIDTFAREARGLIKVVVVDQNQMIDLVLNLEAKGEAALVRSMALRTATQIMRLGSGPTPLLCFCCPRPLVGQTFSIGFVLPVKPVPHLGLGLGICKECAADKKGVEGKMVEQLRNMWPDVRVVDLKQGHAPGHA